MSSSANGESDHTRLRRAAARWGMGLAWLLAAATPAALAQEPAPKPAPKPAPAAAVSPESNPDSLPDGNPDGSPAIPTVLRIDFESAESWGGGTLETTEGPRPPLYPGFAVDNRAGWFSPKAEGPKFVDGGNRADLRFGLDESVTLEAWVRPDSAASGAYVYLFGKGRNGRRGYPDNNQNYALRLKGDAAGVKLNFLFGSLGEDGKSRKWHRWTSREVLPNDRPWHHVAVSYTFGKSESLKAVIDGKETAGEWDMDGKTSSAPASDDDDLTLGNGNGGGAGNRFVGALDQVAVHRGIVPIEELKRRFSFSPQPPSIDVSRLPAGKVLVEICEEGVASSTSWPAQSPVATEQFTAPAFGVVDVPTKYVESGVRGERPNPFVLRAVAKVNIPAGKHRWLLRARGLTRLYVDDQAVLTLAPMKGDSGGHGYVPRVDEYLNLGPEFRFAPPGTQEAWKELEVAAGEHLVVMETIVGGSLGGAKVRPELGETVVAVSRQGESNWSLLGSDFAALPYDDVRWTEYAQTRRTELKAVDAQRRAALRASFLAQRQSRLDAARRWLASTPETPVPPLPADYPANNPIDHFLADRIEQIRRQAGATQEGAQTAVGDDRIDFFRDIQPIFESVCWDCHKGGKSQGGLKLDALQHALRGGDSGTPAVAPGNVQGSELLARVESTDESTRMPPRGERLTARQIALLKQWIEQGARWPELKVDRFELTPVCDDLTFLRRATLDTVGVPPSAAEIAAFEADSSPDKRRRIVDRLLSDERTADHAMGYWLDLLAENPNILNPTLNNTGPFRWWLYESFVDDKPLDMLVWELVEMRGSERFGGPAGFGVASQNDAPFAAKATIVSSAFLGVEMKCARCHDAPAHESRQEQLFQLAAMLAAKPLEVPATSSVPLAKLTEGGRKPLIQVTLQPGAKVEPTWPFAGFGAAPSTAVDPTANTREQLARLLTAPENERFAQVMANRIWARLMGRGIVEPVEDWERGAPTHPELLRWLGRELVRGEYQPKHLMRLIMNSHAYQRATDPSLATPSPLFTAPAVRRLTAEQIVDGLFAATGKPFRLEEVSLDIDGRRDLKNSISLGIPRRSWMLTSTSNERDRPSLALPRVQAIVDVLQAFGWRGARQDPASHRDTAPNALQPAILANGVASVWLTRLSDDHGFTTLALESSTVDELVEQLYLRTLTRRPSEEERRRITDYLAEGFPSRRVQKEAPTPPATLRQPERYVSWSNHLDPEATVIRQQQEAAARRGDPPTSRLADEWRERLEDVIWTLVNSPEVAFAR